MASLREARIKREQIVAELRRVVRLCNCRWPLVKYRNGDGHHETCPAHLPLAARFDREGV